MTRQRKTIHSRLRSKLVRATPVNCAHCGQSIAKGLKTVVIDLAGDNPYAAGFGDEISRTFCSVECAKAGYSAAVERVRRWKQRADQLDS